MHAVIKSGGKQYKVEKGQLLKLEKIEAEVGASIELDQVLLVADGDKVNVGQPLVAGAKVVAEVVAQGRLRKIKVLKFKRRKNYMRTQGHRQQFTQVKVTDIKSA